MSKLFRLKGLDPVFFVSHLLFLGISYCIYLSPHIAPSTFPYFGFIPIFYPLIVLANLILLLILLSRRLMYALLFTILSIGLLPPLSNTYQYFGEKVTVEPDFKVLSFNAQYMRGEGFANFFNQEKADLILLQEVYWRDDLFKELKTAALTDYYHEKHGLVQIFSKFPIIEFQQILSESKNAVATAAYADIDLGQDTLRVINVYLETMLIDKSLVKEGINSVDQAKSNSQILKNKLTKGFLMHENQIQKIIPFIVNSPHPVLLAGDLNAVPNSYEYQQFLYQLKDAYHQVGRSSGTSFHDFKYPLRLDYIFHSEEILPTKYQVLHDIKLSDHYPVVAYFKMP